MTHHAQISKGKVQRAIHRALKHWGTPTRQGLDVFTQMLVPVRYGFSVDLPIVDGRVAINRMLSTYIHQLSRLQPKLADILISRFKAGESTKQVAFRLHASQEQINRMQRLAILYLAELIYDEETRRRAQI
jgi:hypothetical protein